MKLGIKIDNTFLDLYENTTVTIELRNPAIKPSDPDILPGSFALPFRVPMNTKNAQILYHANLLPSAPQSLLIFSGGGSTTELSNEPPIYRGRDCQIIYDGIPLIEGKAYIKKADNTSCFLHVVVGKMPDLKDINLTDIDYGDTIDIKGGIGQPWSKPTEHAIHTARNPEEHNHIFFPVYNTQFFSQADPEEEDLPDLTESTAGYRYHNYFILGEFTNNPNHLIATPFVKINYILERIFLHIDYHIDNQFNQEGELAKLCIYNNVSIYNENLQWGDLIDYKNHLPNIPAADFIKELAKLFALGLYTAPFISGTTVIKPLRDVINSEPKKDWTKYTHHTYEVEFDDQPIRKLQFDPDYVRDLDRNFDFNNEFDLPEDYTIVDTVDDFLNATEPGNYFILVTNQFAQKLPNNDTSFMAFRMPPYIDNNIDRQTEITMKLAPAVPIDILNSTLVGLFIWIVPIVNNPGTFAPFSLASSPPLRLLLYRGMQDAESTLGGGPTMEYPMASSNIYDITKTKIADQSLLWQGDEGLYNTFWKEWHYTQRFNKRVRRRFNLPLSEIISFNFDQLIQSENQKYMVETMRITLTPQGIKPIDTIMMQVSSALELEVEFEA